MSFAARKNVVDLSREGFGLGKLGQNTKGHETMYSFIDFKTSIRHTLLR